jgi:hypothetical protein
MKKPNAVVTTVKLSAVVFLAVASGSCGGGGAAPAAQEAVSAPPSSSAAPPTATPAAPATSGETKPALQLEREQDGSTFLRVTELDYDPFGATGPEKSVKNELLGPAPGSNTVIEGTQSTLVSNVVVKEMKYGLSLQESAMVSINGYTYSKFNGGGSIYGGAIKLGDNGRPTNGPTYIQRVAADGMQTPDPTYKVSNNDFLGVEVDSGPIYVRGVTGRNFGDAGIDTKSTQVYVMNATLSGGHRMLRAWPGVEIILVNSIINASADNSQGWLGDSTASVRYYNTLWCQNASDPSPSDPNCRTAPFAVEGEDMTFTVAAARFIPLQTNPLPDLSPFFASKIDQIVLEYSKNGGGWTTLPAKNTGGPGQAPVGDTRYKVPLDLEDGTYRFRASFRNNGIQIGAVSDVIGEDGLPIIG